MPQLADLMNRPFWIFLLFQIQLPWVPEDIFFLSTLTVRGEAALRKKKSSGTQGKIQQVLITKVKTELVIKNSELCCFHNDLLSVPLLKVICSKQWRFALVFIQYNQTHSERYVSDINRCRSFLSWIFSNNNYIHLVDR